ncbi:MAG: non-homologous end-joining DNA ligase [Myxococcaceae bacterium]
MAKKKSSLQEYRRKRDFAVTPEPAPGETRSRTKTPTFMVHKHDATRLHYDLRLEMDGALASWAIPKGPSYDPGQKRLAVQTEDHPLEYGGFEGRIPDGEYGAGDSLIWDRGTYDTVPPGQASAQRQKGHLHLKLEGEKLKGEWHLVRTRPQGGKAQWLCFKAKDGKEDPELDVIVERPESVASGRKVTRGPVRKKALGGAHPNPEALLKRVWPPMLATLTKSTEGVTPKSHVLEIKYDGYRGLAALSAGNLAFQSRNGAELSGRFPQLAQALKEVPLVEAVLDGEVVVFDAKGISRFQELMTDSARERYVVFDLLWLDGEDLRERPLEERRDLLESVLANAKAPLQISQQLEADTAEALEKIRQLGGEGLIAKRRGSPYVGTRSKDWLKLKTTGAREARKETPKGSSEVEVEVSNPQKLMFPKSGIAKGEVAEYYRDVAPFMVKALEGRPLALQQWPKGIHAPGFYRQSVHHPPDWATTVTLKQSGKDVEHVIVDKEETLVWLANQNALTLHMFSSRVPKLGEPDWVVFDLDPGKGSWDDLIQLATSLRGLLEQLKLQSVPKTSGKRGLHVIVPLAKGHTQEDARDFAIAITETLAKGLPKLATTERSIAKRGGRLYLDAFQNGEGKTIVAPYSLRALEGAPVSTPLHWSEVTSRLDPTQFNLKTLRQRLDEEGDLFADALAGTQRLPRLKT